LFQGESRAVCRATAATSPRHAKNTAPRRSNIQ